MTRMKTRAAVAVVGLVVLLSSTPSSAFVTNTSGTSTSTTIWSTGSTRRHQTVAGDDLAIDLTGGPGIDARWMKCEDGSIHGATVSDIYTSEGWNTLGTDFRPDTCFKIQWRGAQQTGSWTANLHYQANWL